MGSQREQMKGVLLWLVHWALHAGTRDFWDFCPALAALAGPVQYIFFFNINYFNSFVPIAPSRVTKGNAHDNWYCKRTCIDIRRKITTSYIVGDTDRRKRPAFLWLFILVRLPHPPPLPNVSKTSICDTESRKTKREGSHYRCVSWREWGLEPVLTTANNRGPWPGG